ncbi:hypothetical protein ACOKFD_10600 [Flagellimonas sp. S174]|uniref:hypothetical protein n=1 Tax=Flagellimonas sp. S174 TaxID=3410790 RepID=UPI00261A8722|nr:hypothetical protein [uncultured Allomuricauda sp.]
MSETLVFILFLLPSLICVGLCFIKDAVKGRGLILNILLILNALLYLFPLAYAFFSTPPDGNMWDENGPGAILWLYFMILPICGLAFIVLLILKLVFRRKG